MSEYRCQFCGANFVLGSLLNDHLNRVHDKQMLDIKSPEDKIDDLMRRVHVLECQIAELLFWKANL